MTAGLARALWAENADLARTALVHPFVRGLASGTLPSADFGAYVWQDAYFLEAFARAYATAAAKSPDRVGLVAFTRLQAGVIDELKLHSGYAERWGIDLARGSALGPTSDYVAFLAEAARHDLGRICAAMTPCMRLYAYLGQELARTAVGEGNPYEEWIASYSSPDFQDLAAELERLLDRYGADPGPLHSTYRQAMQLEVAFFDAHAPEGVEA